MSNTEINTKLLQPYNAYIEAAMPNFKYFGSAQNIKDLSRTLNQYGNNSIMLTGPAGIGRRSLIAGFVQNLNSENTPLEMMNLDVYRLNVQELFNTQSIPDIEKKFTEILAELADIKQRHGKKPLFIIDDGTSFAREVSDRKLSGLLNKLIAADVASDDFDLILSMDNDAQHMIKKSYPNFLSHFAEQKVKEADDNDIRDMLIHEAERYSPYKLTIAPEAIDKAIEMCKRYKALGEFSMPKRVSLFMDEVATEYRLEAHSRPEGIEQDEALLAQYTTQLETSEAAQKEQIERDIAAVEATLAEKQSKWEQARADLKPIMDEIQETEAYSSGLLEKVKKAEQKMLDATSSELISHKNSGKHTDMSVESFMNSEHFNMRQSKDLEINKGRTQIQTNNDHIAKISQKLNAKAQELMFPITLSADYVDEYAKTKLGMNDVPDMDEVLLTLEEDLNNEIYGQEAMVNLAVNAISNRSQGLDDNDGPIANLLILGPPGTGKTLFAKSLAKVAFGNKDKISRFQMQDFMKEHDVARLIGAPPGYAGYESEAQIITAYKKNPAGVNLFDEIEKAHDDTLLKLLTILDEGFFEAANGKDTADFSDCINILTSNYGKELFQQLPYDEACKAVEEKFKTDSKFPPEFRSRCQLTFANFHSDETLFKIVLREIEDLNTRLHKKQPDFNVQMDEQSIKDFIKKHYDPDLGARKIEKTFKNDITTQATKEILIAKSEAKKKGLDVKDFKISGSLQVSMQDDELTFKREIGTDIKSPSNENNVTDKPIQQAKKAFDLA